MWDKEWDKSGTYVDRPCGTEWDSVGHKWDKSGTKVDTHCGTVWDISGTEWDKVGHKWLHIVGRIGTVWDNAGHRKFISYIIVNATLSHLPT